MVSAELLSQISKQIVIAKWADPNSMDKPFGGVNIIFTGDLGQLHLVGSAFLFSTDLNSHLKPHLKETKKGQDALFGASVWKQLTHVVELKQNVRARGDADHVMCLLCMCKGNGSLHATDGPLDYKMLQNCILENLVPPSLLHCTMLWLYSVNDVCMTFIMNRRQCN